MVPQAIEEKIEVVNTGEEPADKSAPYIQTMQRGHPGWL
jgi:hypothetical protein